MRLLFAIKHLNGAVGGAERVLCTVASELAARGHEVIIVSFDHAGDEPFYPLAATVRRIELGVGDVVRSARLGETLRRVRVLRRCVSDEAPDVAIGFMHSMFVPLAFALAGTEIPVVGSEHIVPEHYRTRPLQFALLLMAAPLMAKVTVLSAAIRIRYPAVVRRRMVDMPNPVAPATGDARLLDAKSRRVLLNVGRFEPQKDQATLVRAFARIAPDHPDWDLRIVGDGSLRPELQSLSVELGIADRVAMPGIAKDIGAEYRAADTFVISSAYEAFGLVTAEAMSHGLPVVGFADCPGTNELIETNRTGVLVDPGRDRIASLASALSKLMADPALRQRLGVAGWEAIDSQFSPKYVCERWEGLLRPLSSLS